MPQSGDSAGERQRQPGRRYARALLAAVSLLGLGILSSPHAERESAGSGDASAAAPAQLASGGELDLGIGPQRRSASHAIPPARWPTTSGVMGYGANQVQGNAVLAAADLPFSDTSAVTLGSLAPPRSTGAARAVNSAPAAAPSGTAGPLMTQLTDSAEAAALFVALGGPLEPEPPAEPAEPPRPGYQDQYLLDDSDLPAFEAGSSFAAQPFGQRYLSAEMIYYKSDDDFFGEDIERGGRVYWSQETENWGTIDLDLQIADIDSSFVGRQSTGSEMLATFRQSAMPVSQVATLDTALGHQRTAISSLLHGGYRYRLPTSIVLGASGELVGIDRKVRVAIGDVGAYRGVRLPRFDDTGGRLASFGYEQNVNDRLDLGAELAHVRDDDDIRDHTSVLLAGRYALPDNSREHAIRFLADDDGNIGLWADNRHQLGRLPTLRWGVTYLDPELVWADLPIADDQVGVYLRADSSNSRFNYSLGYDYLSTGVASSAASSADTHSLFATGNVRLTRALSLGVSSTLASRNISAVVEDDQDIVRLSAFMGLHSVLGGARLEVFSYDLDSRFEGNRRKRSGVAASMSWRTPERIRLTTDLRTERDEDLRGLTHRTELSAQFRYDLFEDISLGLNTAIYDTRGVEYAQDGGLSLSADARWVINRNWNASLSLNRNSADYVVDGDVPGLGSADGEAGQSSVWLTVQYQRRSGQPYPSFGRTHDGLSGSGSVSGQVFFDENRDSIRQLTEQLAVGVVVLLDGRYETRTDRQGRYSFSPVPTGAHELRVLTEDLPLPWGLDDESPRRVIARFRQDTSVDFALTIMQ